VCRYEDDASTVAVIKALVGGGMRILTLNPSSGQCRAKIYSLETFDGRGLGRALDF